jgi:hypothetical protein
MSTHGRIISSAICGLLFLSVSAARFVATGSRAPSFQNSAPAACTLLTPAEAGAALEASSQPGKEEGMGPTGCIWSNDPAAGDTSRRVGVNTHSIRAFDIAKKPAITTIKIESVSGIGDEAFYQIYPNDQSPFIWVRKGKESFSIRILTRIKPARPFTIDQEKSKLVVLAKAALGRL